MTTHEKYVIATWIALGFCAATMQGCGRQPIIDSALQPYVDRWNSIYEEKVTVDVVFGGKQAFQGNVVGMCLNTTEVVIDRDYWDRSLDQGREELVFHELGHCVLGLGHDRNEVIRVDDIGNNQVLYRSIMYPATFGNTPMYNDNHSYYVDQLKRSHASEE